MRMDAVHVLFDFLQQMKPNSLSTNTMYSFPCSVNKSAVHSWKEKAASFIG